MADAHSATCFCGAVAIEAEGAPEEMGYCHCSSCRAYSGAPVTGFSLWRSDQVKIVRGEQALGRFNKTGFSERRFCTSCGGHLMTEHPGMGFTDIYAALLPTLAFNPSVHLNYAETVLPFREGLPKLKEFPDHAGGSGELVAD